MSSVLSTPSPQSDGAARRLSIGLAWASLWLGVSLLLAHTYILATLLYFDYEGRTNEWMRFSWLFGEDFQLIWVWLMTVSVAAAIFSSTLGFLAAYASREVRRVALGGVTLSILSLVMFFAPWMVVWYRWS
jgi:hypothetical protein